MKDKAPGEEIQKKISELINGLKDVTFKVSPAPDSDEDGGTESTSKAEEKLDLEFNLKPKDVMIPVLCPGLCRLSKVWPPWLLVTCCCDSNLDEREVPQ